MLKNPKSSFKGLKWIKNDNNMDFRLVFLVVAIFFYSNICNAKTDRQHILETGLSCCIEQEKCLQRGGKAVLEVTPGIDWQRFASTRMKEEMGNGVFLECSWNAETAFRIDMFRGEKFIRRIVFDGKQISTGEGTFWDKEFLNKVLGYGSSRLEKEFSLLMWPYYKIFVRHLFPFSYKGKITYRDYKWMYDIEMVELKMMENTPESKVALHFYAKPEHILESVLELGVVPVFFPKCWRGVIGADDDALVFETPFLVKDRIPVMQSCKYICDLSKENSYTWHSVVKKEQSDFSHAPDSKQFELSSIECRKKIPYLVYMNESIDTGFVGLIKARIDQGILLALRTIMPKEVREEWDKTRLDDFDLRIIYFLGTSLCALLLAVVLWGIRRFRNLYATKSKTAITDTKNP